MLVKELKEAEKRMATALAKLIEDPGAIVVPADSPFATVGDFVAAWRADPSAVTIGGGSAPGGPDHLFAMRLAETVGIDPVSVDYVTHDGGGDLLAALFSDEVSVSTSSPGEFLAQIDAGQLRVLAVSSDEEVARIDAPTLRAAGIDLESHQGEVGITISCHRLRLRALVWRVPRLRPSESWCRCGWQQCGPLLPTSHHVPGHRAK